jgi:hypothetical protein
MQNSVTSLAIISGYILRDMYFAKQFCLSVCQQRKSELQKWMANLPNPFRQQVESGVILNLSKDQNEAVVSSQSEKKKVPALTLPKFNLHFMQLGTWMLLTRPSLLKAVREGMSATNFAGPLVSAISSDARVWYVTISN